MSEATRWFWILILPIVSFAAVDDILVFQTADPNLASFDRMMVAFLKKHEVPGATLAVAKDGKLVYARGFGFAELDQRQPMEARSLMRVASVSKPITAVAILRLMEEGKLTLDDLVFDLLKIQPHLEGNDRFDPRWKKITIRHLLQHTGGWDREKAFDPMFRPVMITRSLGVKPPARPEHIIRYMAGKPLQFDPGERYAYSNFGYCLLGRVIEKVSGKSYEQYVRDTLLAPLGVKDMKIGKTLLAHRTPREAHYYDQKRRHAKAIMGPMFGREVPLPYGAWHLEAMDAHGGWIASAPDLVRFASAVSADKRPLLQPKSVRVMFARPEGSVGLGPKGKPRVVYYGCGWNVRMLGKDRINTWHNGLLDGTASLLVRRWDGLCWAVLFNSDRGPEGEYLAAAIDPLVHQAADAVTWGRGE